MSWIEEKDKFEKSADISQIFKDLNENGIDIDEELFVNNYNASIDLIDLYEYYEGLYAEQWNTLKEKGSILCTDIIFALGQRILPSKTNVFEKGDIFFVDLEADYITKHKKIEKDELQKRIMNILEGLTNYKESIGCYYLDEVSYDIDYNAFLLQYIQQCDTNDPEMLHLLEVFYEAFEDGNPAICPAAFKNQKIKSLSNYKKNDSKKNPLEDIFKELNENGIDLTEDKIVIDYAEVKNAEELDNRYYEEYKGKWNLLEKKNSLLNEDTPYHLIKRIIPMHYDLVEIGDTWFINDMIEKLEKTQKKVNQKDVEDVILALIHCGKKNKTGRLSDIEEHYYDNQILIDYVKQCHDRHYNFHKLMIEFYNTFEDADQKIFPSAYKKRKASK